MAIETPYTKKDLEDMHKREVARRRIAEEALKKIQAALVEARVAVLELLRPDPKASP